MKSLFEPTTHVSDAIIASLGDNFIGVEVIPTHTDTVLGEFGHEPGLNATYLVNAAPALFSTVHLRDVPCLIGTSVKLQIKTGSGLELAKHVISLTRALVDGTLTLLTTLPEDTDLKLFEKQPNPKYLGESLGSSCYASTSANCHYLVFQAYSPVGTLIPMVFKANAGGYDLIHHFSNYLIDAMIGLYLS